QTSGAARFRLEERLAEFRGEFGRETEAGGDNLDHQRVNGLRISTPSTVCPSFRSSLQSTPHSDAAAECNIIASQKFSCACLQSAIAARTSSAVGAKTFHFENSERRLAASSIERG